MIKPFIYNASIERIAAKARVADNDTELSAICEQLNVANKIFLGKIDLWLAKQALSAVYRTLKKYPALRNIIHYFGTLNGFIQNKDILFFDVNGQSGLYTVNTVQQMTDEVAISCKKKFENNGLGVAFFLAVGTDSMGGIIINGKSLNQQTIVKNLLYAEQIGHSPKGCNSVKAIIEHEIGHLMDYLLGISSCDEINKIIKSYSADFFYNNLSHYCVAQGVVDTREVVAEAYAEYCNNPQPREIANKIGIIINKKYMEKYGR